MAGITLGFLKYILGFDSLAFEQGATNSQKLLRQMERNWQRTADSIGEFGSRLSVAVTAPLAGIAAVGIQEARATAEAMGQVNAALSSMGPVAGRSAEQLSALADQLELNSLAEADEILKSVTANLLTFGNVTGDTFDRAQQAIVDLSARMGTDLQSATILVGRALNDPIKGMAALTRTGIQFTAAQRDAIKAMVETGNTAGAQAIILDELNRQFGGAAAAAQATDPWNRATDAFKQMAETVGTALLPVLPVISDAVVTVTSAFTSLSPEAQKFLIIAGGIAAAVGPVAIGLSSVISVLAPAAAAIGAASAAAGAGAVGWGALTAAAAPWLAIGAGIAAVGLVIYDNWDKIGPVLSDLGKQVMDSLGPVMIDTFNRVKQTLTELWEGPFGEGIRTVGGFLVDFQLAWYQAIGPVLLAALRLVGATMGTTFELVGNLLRGVAALLTGDFSGAWSIAMETVGDLIAGFGRMIEAVFPGALQWMQSLYTGVKTWLQDRLGAVFQWVQDKVQAVGDAFFWLYDRVVGNSYVPDMVDGIRDHMSRLDAEMVAPAQRATSAAAQAFRELQQQVSGLLDRLFPEAARYNQYQRDLAALAEYHRRGALSAELHAEAVHQLNREYLGIPSTAEFARDAVARLDLFGDDGKATIDAQTERELQRNTEALMRSWGIAADGLEATNVRIVESFAEMVQGALGSIDKLVKGIKSGNILDIVSGIFGALDKIGGAFGGFNVGPFAFGGARAEGGPVSSGRTYLVGERGPELFTPSRSGAIIANDNLRGGPSAIRVTIDAGPGIHAIARDEAGRVIGQTGPTIAAGGSLLAQQDLARRNAYEIPA